MKLTTDKKYIVFRELKINSYFYCGKNFLERTYDDDEYIPILYTNDIELAKKVIKRLNEITLDLII